MIPPLETPRRLSVELFDLAEHFDRPEVEVRELMDRFQGRVYTLMLVLLSLPFCQPMALPGLSTPFGVVISLLGFRMALRKEPWLPERLMKVTISAKVLLALLKAGGKVLRTLEKLLHPRASWIFDFKTTHIVGGLLIGMSGLLLLLPLPVPLSNLFPALVILSIAASTSERDGVMFLGGATLFLFTLLFFAAIFLGGKELWVRAKDFILTWLSS